MWRDIYNSKYKHVVKDDKTGKIREVIYDQKYREAEKRGDMLQPIGRDKRKWLQMHKGYYENPKGELMSKEREKEKKEAEARTQEQMEKEAFNKRGKKYY